MRSRAARWTFVTVAWIALIAAGVFLFTTLKQIATEADAARAVDLHAREAESERNLFRRVRYSCSGPPLLFPFCCPAPQGLQLGNGASIGGRDFPRVRKVEAA